MINYCMIHDWGIMMEASDIWNDLLKENEIAFDIMELTIERSREALAEMSRMLQHLIHVCQDVVENVLPFVQSLLINLETTMEQVRSLKLALTQALEESSKLRRETLWKLEGFFHLQLNLVQQGPAREIITQQFVAAKNQVLEITQPEQEWLEQRRSHQKKFNDQAQLVDNLLSKLRIYTKLDITGLGRTL